MNSCKREEYSFRIPINILIPWLWDIDIARFQRRYSSFYEIDRYEDIIFKTMVPYPDSKTWQMIGNLDT